VPRDFDFRFFHEPVSPKSLSIIPVSAIKTTSVVDTGGNLAFATGVIDARGKFAAGIVDTGGKFATDINSTSGTSGKKPVLVIPVVHLNLQISLRIFEKIRIDHNYFQGLGGRKTEAKNLVTLSL
jgi:hypothetical protein